MINQYLVLLFQTPQKLKLKPKFKQQNINKNTIIYSKKGTHAVNGVITFQKVHLCT